MLNKNIISIVFNLLTFKLKLFQFSEWNHILKVNNTTIKRIDIKGLKKLINNNTFKR